MVFCLIKHTMHHCMCRTNTSYTSKLVFHAFILTYFLQHIHTCKWMTGNEDTITTLQTLQEPNLSPFIPNCCVHVETIPNLRLPLSFLDSICSRDARSFIFHHVHVSLCIPHYLRAVKVRLHYCSAELTQTWEENSPGDVSLNWPTRGCASACQRRRQPEDLLLMPHLCGRERDQCALHQTPRWTEAHFIEADHAPPSILLWTCVRGINHGNSRTAPDQLTFPR